jgi:hypothetical protein
VAIFSWIAYYNFVHVKGWYHHRVYLVILASIFLSMGAGTAFFYLGVGRNIDQVLSANMPYYELMKIDKKALWSHPDDGLLGGEIVKISDSSDFVIKDYSGNEWAVEKSSAEIGNTAVVVGERVKLIGKEKNKQTFEAKEIRQWDPQARKNSEDKNQHAKKDGGSEE